MSNDHERGLAGKVALVTGGSRAFFRGMTTPRTWQAAWPLTIVLTVLHSTTSLSQLSAAFAELSWGLSRVSDHRQNNLIIFLLSSLKIHLAHQIAVAQSLTWPLR